MWFHLGIVLLIACALFHPAESLQQEAIAATLQLELTKAQRVIFLNRTNTGASESSDFCAIFMDIIKQTKLGLEQDVYFCNVKSHTEVQEISRTQLLFVFQQPYFRRNTLQAWKRYISYDFIALFFWWFRASGFPEKNTPKLKMIDIQIRSINMYVCHGTVYENNAYWSRYKGSSESEVIRRIIGDLQFALEHGNLTEPLLSMQIAPLPYFGFHIEAEANLFFDHARLVDVHLRFLGRSVAYDIEHIINTGLEINRANRTLHKITVHDPKAMKKEDLSQGVKAPSVCSEPIEMVSFTSKYTGDLYQNGTILRNLPSTGIEELKTKMIDRLISSVNAPLKTTLLLRRAQVTDVQDKVHQVKITVELYVDTAVLAAVVIQANAQSPGAYLDELMRAVRMEDGVRDLLNINRVKIVAHTGCAQELISDFKPLRDLLRNAGIGWEKSTGRSLSSCYFTVGFLLVWAL